MSSSRYVLALSEIPSGETRTFTELAALAGRPGAARAAGRAIASCGTSSDPPWHRVVPADGRPRGSGLQLERLRAEGARPRQREPINAWAERVQADFVGLYGKRVLLPRDSDRLRNRWDPLRVEPFKDEARAHARGFYADGEAPAAAVLLPPRPKAVTLPRAPTRPVGARVRELDWRALRGRLERDGVAHVERFLGPHECAHVLRDASSLDRFERSIDMLARGYGFGSYHYYREPLPEPLMTLRAQLYAHLRSPDGPPTLSEFWEACRRRGQLRASSILIGYPEGGVNHPHRDVYGPVHFSFQALVLLSRKGRDFTGGEFYVEDERDGHRRLVDASEGDLVIFATRQRRDGERAIALRHGMTQVSSGTRFGVGIVFHLAE